MSMGLVKGQRLFANPEGEAREGWGTIKVPKKKKKSKMNRKTVKGREKILEENRSEPITKKPVTKKGG